MRWMMMGVAAAALMGTAWADHEGDEPKTFSAAMVFELEYASDPQISPDGEHVVYVRRSMDIEKDAAMGTLWLVDVSSGEQRPLLEGGSQGGAPRWSPDGSKIAFLSVRDGGKPDLKVHLLEDDRTYSRAKLQEGASPVAWAPDGDHLAFTMLVPEQPMTLGSLPPKPDGAEWAPAIQVTDELTFRFDGAGYLTPGDDQVFVVPVEGGTPKQVTHMPGGMGQATWLDDTALLAVGNPDEKRDLQPSIAQLFRVPLDGAEPVALTSRTGVAFAPTVSPNGTRVAFLAVPDGEKTHQQTELFVMGADGSDAKNVTLDYDRPLSGIAWHPKGSSLLATTLDRGTVRLVEFGLGGEVKTLATDVGGEGVGRPYDSGSFSVSSKGTVAYTQQKRSRPADLAVLSKGEAKTLTQLNEDALGDVAMAKIEKFEVPSSVGDYKIDAWVAYPPNYKKDGSAPLLLEIHGGPYAMYGDFFSAEIERYAAEGYVTVWTNPRGATGYGLKFAQEIDLAYPSKDYDDLMSGVDFMVKGKYASEDRLFVTGGSGGGVLTAWIVGSTDRFAAAASIKPVINWTSEALAADISAFTALEWLREMPWENQELYWKLSPLSKVGNVTTPTLMMAGSEDWRTPTWEAEQFYTALKLQGVDTAMVRVPGASHYIARRPSHLIAKTEAIMAWFDKYDEAASEE